MELELYGPEIYAKATGQQQDELEHRFSKTVPAQLVPDIATSCTVMVEKGCGKQVAGLHYTICSDAFNKEDFIESIKDHEYFQRLDPR